MGTSPRRRPGEAYKLCSCRLVKPTSKKPQQWKIRYYDGGQAPRFAYANTHHRAVQRVKELSDKLSRLAGYYCPPVPVPSPDGSFINRPHLNPPPEAPAAPQEATPGVDLSQVGETYRERLEFMRDAVFKAWAQAADRQDWSLVAKLQKQFKEAQGELDALDAAEEAAKDAEYAEDDLEQSELDRIQTMKENELCEYAVQLAEKMQALLNEEDPSSVA